MNRRKLLKLMGTGSFLLSSGFIGVPLSSCSASPGEGEGEGQTDRADDDLDCCGRDLEPVDISDAEEMTQSEVEDFIEEAEMAGDPAADLTDDQGRPRIPPGQRVLEAMPVLGRNPDPRELAEWSFRISGEVENELHFTWEEFAELSHVQQTCDVHCVTGWTVLDTQWGGVRVADLLERAGLTDRSRYVIFDCEQGYTTNIPAREAMKDNVLIATSLFGEPLPPEYGGLARGLVPDLYYYKSGKWVTGIRVLNEDEPGYWEVRGYSNTADPWTEDRLG